jgi:uncharacterized RDD family membrane protein YckC
VSLDERYTIDTPENVELSYTIAGIGSRFLAAIIDTFLLLLLQLVLVLALFLVTTQLAVASSTESILLAVWGLLSFIFFWGYYILFEMVWNGQTPGKRFIRLRVVREGGRPITFASAAIRNLIRIIDFLPGFYGLGVLVMFIDRRARRLGDLAGGTLVVRDKVAVSLEALTGAVIQPRPARQEYLSTLEGAAAEAEAESFQPTIANLHLITANDYDLVQEFLRRRRELGHASRRNLGRQLADRVGERLGLTLNQGDHETFLEHLAYEYRMVYEEQQATLGGGAG